MRSTPILQGRDRPRTYRVRELDRAHQVERGGLDQDPDVLGIHEVREPLLQMVFEGEDDAHVARRHEMREAVVLDMAEGVLVVRPVDAVLDHRLAIVAHGHGGGDDLFAERRVQVPAAGGLVRRGRESRGECHWGGHLGLEVGEGVQAGGVGVVAWFYVRTESGLGDIRGKSRMLHRGWLFPSTQ
jgi:hypothetical protein